VGTRPAISVGTASAGYSENSWGVNPKFTGRKPKRGAINDVHWVVLAVSCAAIVAGMEMAEVMLVMGGLVGLIIGLLLGPKKL